jgi:hypothetical protein
MAAAVVKKCVFWEIVARRLRVVSRGHLNIF